MSTERKLLTLKEARELALRIGREAEQREREAAEQEAAFWRALEEEKD